MKMSEDFLKSNVSFADRDVFILGSGPNGAGHYGNLPNGDVADVIAVNRAVIVAPLFAYWLCITSGVLSERYFHEHMVEHMESGTSDPILAEGRLTEAYPETPYHVTLAHPIGHDSYNVIPGHIRRGAGTVGAALHIAHQKQAKRCILIGVDMHGRGYFDGTENKAKGSIHPDGTWTQLTALQRVVDWCKGNGMDVVSMSETKLKLEMI